MSKLCIYCRAYLLTWLDRYTRSTNAAKGKKSVVLETKNEVSQEYSKSIKVSEEGTYEVVSIRDRYCGFSTQRTQGKLGQQLLTFR